MWLNDPLFSENGELIFSWGSKKKLSKLFSDKIDLNTLVTWNKKRNSLYLFLLQRMTQLPHLKAHPATQLTTLSQKSSSRIRTQPRSNKRTQFRTQIQLKSQRRTNSNSGMGTTYQGPPLPGDGLIFRHRPVFIKARSLTIMGCKGTVPPWLFNSGISFHGDVLVTMIKCL